MPAHYADCSSCNKFSELARGYHCESKDETTPGIPYGNVLVNDDACVYERNLNAPPNSLHYADCPSCKLLRGINDNESFECIPKRTKMKTLCYIHQMVNDPTCQFFPFIPHMGLNERFRTKEKIEPKPTPQLAPRTKLNPQRTLFYILSEPK